MIMNKYIQRLINEQFNISDLDFTDTEQEYDNNIFNKQLVNPHDVYNKIVNFNDINKYEIEFINDLVSEVTPKDYAALHDITDFYSANYPEYSMNWLNVSGITKMETLFDGGMGDEYDEDTFNNYNGDISKWDVSNVKTLFNGDISEWDVSNVEDMSWMFGGDGSHVTVFNRDISKWDTSKVKDMSHMFYCSKFNIDISGWDVSHVEDMSYMFTCTEFNHDISRWNVSRVTNMTGMFQFSDFNRDISRWDVHNVRSMSQMFQGSKFNQDISRWNVSNVMEMEDMFAETEFNYDISNWDVSNVIMYNDIFKWNEKMEEKHKPEKFKNK